MRIQPAKSGSPICCSMLWPSLRLGAEFPLTSLPTTVLVFAVLAPGEETVRFLRVEYSFLLSPSFSESFVMGCVASRGEALGVDRAWRDEDETLRRLGPCSLGRLNLLVLSGVASSLYDESQHKASKAITESYLGGGFLPLIVLLNVPPKMLKRSALPASRLLLARA